MANMTKTWLCLSIPLLATPLSSQVSAFVITSTTDRYKKSHLGVTTTSTTSPPTSISDNINAGPRIPINEEFPGLFRIHSNPDIYVIRNYLSQEHCHDIIEKAKSKTLERSPVAYAGWTTDFKELLELFSKGPIVWIALLSAWVQVKDVDNANQMDLILQAIQNYFVGFVLTTTAIAAFTYSRSESLKALRTSTSTTLDDLTTDPTDGVTEFVRHTTKLFHTTDTTTSSLQQEALYFEAPTVIRYESGQVLAPHYDANRSADIEDSNRGGQTLATLIVYLNNVDEGGLTRFGKLYASKADNKNNIDNENINDDKLTIQPKIGDALLFFPADQFGTFDPRTEHEGMPAVDEKWIARIWKHQQRVLPPFGLSENGIEKI